MQICEDDLLVVRAGEQVVRVHGESHGAHVRRVRLERLDGAVAAHVPQHDAGVLVTRAEQPTSRIHAYRRERAP